MPRQYQQTALMVGIVLALVMRGIFIAVGAAAITSSAGSSTSSARSSSTRRSSWPEDATTTTSEEYEETRSWRFAEKHLPATEEWNGVKLFTEENGKRLVTPM